MPRHSKIVPGIGIMKNQWSNILDVDVHQYGCNKEAAFLLADSRHGSRAGGVHVEVSVYGTFSN